MQRRGIIIRFIDIGLLILFGFLMISDLKGTSQVSFDEGDEVQFFSDRSDTGVLLSVSIESDSRLSIKDLASSEGLYENILSLEELEFSINTLKNRYMEEGKEVAVLIEPAPDAQIQYVVHILDICDRLGLKKNINTEFAGIKNDS